MKAAVIGATAYARFKQANPGFMPSDNEEEEKEEEEEAAVVVVGPVEEEGEVKVEVVEEDDDDNASTIAYGRSTPIYGFSSREEASAVAAAEAVAEEEEEAAEEEEGVRRRVDTPMLESREAKRLARQKLLLIKELEEEEDEIAWETEEEEEEGRKNPERNRVGRKTLKPSALSDIIHGYRLARANLHPRESSPTSLPPPPSSPPPWSPAYSLNRYASMRSSSAAYRKRLEKDFAMKRIASSEEEEEEEEEEKEARMMDEVAKKEKQEAESRRRADPPLNSSFEDNGDASDYNRQRLLLHKPSDHFPPPKHLVVKMASLCGVDNLEPHGLSKDVCQLMARLTDMETQLTCLRNDHDKIIEDAENLGDRVLNLKHALDKAIALVEEAQ